MGKAVFREDELTELIAVYTSVVVHYVLFSCSGTDMQRTMNDAEVQQIMDVVEAASDDFVSAYKRKLARKGISLSKAKTDNLRNNLNEHILADCRTLMQNVSEELQRQTDDEMNRGDTFGETNN